MNSAVSPSACDAPRSTRGASRRWLPPDGDRYFQTLWAIASLSSAHFAVSLVWWAILFWIAIGPNVSFAVLSGLPPVLLCQSCVPYLFLGLFLVAVRMSASGSRWAEPIVMGGLLMAALEFLVEVHYGLAQIHYFGDAEVVTNNFYATWWVYSCGPAWRERNLVMAAGVLLLVIGVTLRLLRMRRSRTTPIEV